MTVEEFVANAKAKWEADRKRLSAENARDLDAFIVAVNTRGKVTVNSSETRWWGRFEAWLSATDVSPRRARRTT